MPIYEFVCQTTECPENTGHLSCGSHRIITKLCKFEDRPICDVCGSDLTRIPSSPPGFVSGTTTPTRC